MTSPYVDSRLAPRSFHEPNVATQDANEVGQVGTDANANAWTQASHGGQSLHSSTPESLNRTLSTPPFPPHASLQHYDHRIAASRSLQATSSSLSEHLDWLLIPTKPWKTGRQDVLDTQSQQQQINSISTQYFPQSHVSQCFNDGSIDTKALVANPDGFPIWNGWTGHSQTETHFMNLDPPSKDNLTLMNDTNWDVYRYYKASRMTPLLSTDAYVLGALSHKRPHSSSPNDMLASVTASPKQAYQPIHGTYLSEQPTDAATCTLPSADPHATDMHPFDPDLVPRKQDPKDPPNSYLPRWIRGQGKEREAWCECGRWLSLKKSTYWCEYPHSPFIAPFFSSKIPF